MVLHGLEAYLARAEANLRRLEAEDALLQSSAACLGLPSHPLTLMSLIAPAHRVMLISSLMS